MGWFNKQLRKRMRADETAFEESFVELSSVVLGESAISKAINNDQIKTKSAIEEILKFYKAKIIDVPNDIKDMNDQLDYMLRPTGIMRRTVNLTGKWWKDAIGAMLGQTKNGDTVALIPDSLTGYSFYDYQSGKRIRINNKTKDLIEESAFCFYKPYPLRKLKIIDFAQFILSTFTKADILYTTFFSLFGMGLNLLAAPFQQLLIGKIIPSGDTNLLAPFAVLLVGMMISNLLMSLTSGFSSSRISTKLGIQVEAATMSRVMSLPASFFSNYSSGDLQGRVSAVQSFVGTLTSLMFSVGLQTLFSFVFLFQMNTYAPQLVWPSIIFIVLEILIDILGTFLFIDIKRKKMKISLKLNALVYSLFTGVQKIKLTGSEKRAFAKWAKAYEPSAKLDYDPPAYIKYFPMFSQILGLIKTMVIFYVAGSSGLSQADYLAFSVALGPVANALGTIVPIIQKIADMKPVLENIEPILSAEPEISENKTILTNLSGAIDINDVSFKYSDNGPLVLNHFNLKIKPGQYVAIVGKTGCGKSTLMRLMLGFEKPTTGAIYYDGQDINTLDLKSLRQHIGAVMQNGKLFQGDIYSNIVIAAPWLNLEEAWKAAELAGIDKDIKNMPMEMHTMISEGSGGISGGQKQRLMIARAIAPKPSVLMFDEATSALDNITQKKISDSLDTIKSTRIVIAHRLSTIKHCDRIIVIEDGAIIEDGTFDELIALDGYFAELVKRQQIELNEKNN